MQIDILCNDFIAAQRGFMQTLKTIGFSADLQESIAGLTDLNQVLCAAGNLIQGQVRDANIAFFLMESGHLESHIFESSPPTELGEGQIETIFTAELVDNIVKSNRICTVEDMLGMGLQCSPACIEKISAAAMPLSGRSGPVGLILVYRSSQKPLTQDELMCITQIASGLGRSIGACWALMHTIN